MRETQRSTTAIDEFALLMATAAATLVLDVESTKFAQRDPEAAEVNSWIYGERPSRARMYAICIPVTVALATCSAYLKFNSPAEGKNAWAWRIPLLGLGLGHAIAAAANVINFRKRT